MLYIQINNSFFFCFTTVIIVIKLCYIIYNIRTLRRDDGNIIKKKTAEIHLAAYQVQQQQQQPAQHANDDLSWCWFFFFIFFFVNPSSAQGILREVEDLIIKKKKKNLPIYSKEYRAPASCFFPFSFSSSAKKRTILHNRSSSGGHQRLVFPKPVQKGVLFCKQRAAAALASLCCALCPFHIIYYYILYTLPYVYTQPFLMCTNAF